MVELNVLRLVESRLVTNHVSLYIGYSRTDGEDGQEALES